MKALIIILLIALLSSSCFAYLIADLNKDGTVNFLDLSIFLEEWLMSVYHLKFGGAGYVTVADDDVMDFGATDSALICFWMKVTSRSGTDIVLDKMNISRLDTNADDVGWFIYINSDTRIGIRLDGSGGLGANVWVNHGATATDWNHYAFFIDRDNSKTYIYVNSSLKSGGPTSDYGDYSNDANLIIGAQSREAVSDYINYFSGRLEDIRIYKNSVTDSNIASVLADIYNSGVGRPANDDDFTDGWYTRIDDGRGLTVSGRKLSSDVYSAHNGTISSLSDVVWASGGVPFDDGTIDEDWTEHTYYINRTGKTIRFRFSGYKNSQLKEYKILTPTILGDR